MWSTDRVIAIRHPDWGPCVRKREDKGEYVQTKAHTGVTYRKLGKAHFSNSQRAPLRVTIQSLCYTDISFPR